MYSYVNTYLVVSHSTYRGWRGMGGLSKQMQLYHEQRRCVRESGHNKLLIFSIQYTQRNNVFHFQCFRLVNQY